MVKLFLPYRAFLVSGEILIFQTASTEKSVFALVSVSVIFAKWLSVSHGMLGDTSKPIRVIFKLFAGFIKHSNKPVVAPICAASTFSQSVTGANFSFGVKNQVKPVFCSLRKLHSFEIEIALAGEIAKLEGKVIG